MKIVKILGWTLLALVAFIALSVYLTANNLDGIVKQAIERVGSQTLGTEVRLDRVDIKLTEGRAELSGLKIRNLPGFQAKNLFSLDKISVALNLEAMVDKIVDITDVTIDGVHVVAEQKGNTTNIQQLVDKLPQSNEASSKKAGGSGASGIRVKIRRFRFADSSARLVTDRWGERTLSIPAITLNHLGGEKGVPPEALANAILRPLLKQINQSVRDNLRDVVEKKAREALKQKQDDLKSRYQSKLKEKLGDKAGAVEGALNSYLSR